MYIIFELCKKEKEHGTLNDMLEVKIPLMNQFIGTVGISTRNVLTPTYMYIA